MTSKYTYALRGLIYFLAAFLPALSAALLAAQPLSIVLISSLGAGAVAVAGYVDKTAGVRHCDTANKEGNDAASPN